MNYYSDNSEWKWMLKNSMDWQTIIPLYHSRFPTEHGAKDKEDVLDYYSDILHSFAEWASSIEHHTQALNEQGAGIVQSGKTISSEPLKKICQEIAEIKGLGLSLPERYGGMGIPASIDMMSLGFIARADLSVSTQLAFGSSIGEMILRFCDEKMQKKYIPKITSGELSGSMCITEADSGSDLRGIKTTAIRQKDGLYILNGGKIFISNAGGGIALILARIKDAPKGLEGLSLFLATQEDGEKINYHVIKNEKKMGLYGSFTCQVAYENTRAYLLGEENKGLSYMLHLMNEARLAVSFQALGCLEAALYHAKQYAKKRIQFDRPLNELPLMKRNFEDYETERDALRAFIMDTNSYFDIYQFLDRKKMVSELDSQERKKYAKAKIWLRKRTPLVKYYSTEATTRLTQKAIQVLGGHGYMQEYPVERFHRDSFAPLLYEGTSQIQALMALKDIMRYAFKDNKKFIFSIFFRSPYVHGKFKRRFERNYRQFKRKMFFLILKTLRPPYLKILNPKNWQDEKRIENLMTHAETLCQALSYMETLRVLSLHADKDKSRVKLYIKYELLILPRMEKIYKDWTMRHG